MIVDDVRFVLEGEEEAAAAQLPILAHQAVRVLEENLHMCVCPVTLARLREKRWHRLPTSASVGS